jgi:hypothetical protein
MAERKIARTVRLTARQWRYAERIGWGHSSTGIIRALEEHPSKGEDKPGEARDDLEPEPRALRIVSSDTEVF